MSQSVLSCDDHLLVVRCDDIIDTCYGYNDDAVNVEKSVVNQLIERFCLNKFATLDMRESSNLSSEEAITRVITACFNAKEHRILLTVNPDHAQTLAGALSASAEGSGKAFVIAAVSIPAIFRNSDADFVLGVAVGALLSNPKEVSIVALPSVALNGCSDKENMEESKDELAEMWCLKNNGNCGKSKSELLAHWVISSSNAESQHVLSGFIQPMNIEPEMWLAKPVPQSEVGDSDVAAVAATKLERLSSTRSCDLIPEIPDIEELAFCTTFVESSSSGSSSRASSPHVRTNRSNSSSWLKVICRASEPCMNMSECACDPNCSAALLQLEKPPDTLSPFLMPFDTSKWLQDTVKTEAKELTTGLDHWLVSAEKTQHLASKKVTLNDDGWNSNEAKWICYNEEPVF